MATDVTIKDDYDYVLFVIWCGRRDGVGPPLYDFGTVTNFEHVCELLDSGVEMEPMGSRFKAEHAAYFDGTRAGLERAMRDGLVTFGEFPVTVAVGSGAIWRFTVEE